MITDEIMQQAAAGDLAPLRRVPKTDLHNHFILSAPFSTYQRISAGAIKPAPERFGGLEDFLQYLRDQYFPRLQNLDAYLQVARDAFQHMISDGIVYTELSFDTVMPVLLGMSWAELVPYLAHEIAAVREKITILPELGLSRDFSMEDWRPNVRAALETGFFRSIDLYGSETYKEVHEFQEFFEKARTIGAKIKLHSGETGPASRVLREFEKIGPDAIQHGVRASEDARVLEALAKSKVMVNVCPYSNYCLRVVENYADHPIKKMFYAGLRVTINSDDYAIFGKSVSEEYAMLYKAQVFTAAELEEIRLNGLSALEWYLLNKPG